MLQQSFNLFHPERSSAAWDTTLLEQLRTGIHQQLEDLDACLGQVMERKTLPGKDGPHPGCEEVLPGHPCLPAREGIQRLRLEILRVEMMKALSSSTSLQERLRKMGGDLNSP
ncbi:PREDICTED: interferon tau-like [Capra hircus]|uniref:interferon tau-like n=1 Tax=Capra hircus TaxID=9925 RepID=UPI000847BF6D|nr:PREDICTED: interferon tau-like [Capra hircus]